MFLSLFGKLVPELVLPDNFLEQLSWSIVTLQNLIDLLSRKFSWTRNYFDWQIYVINCHSNWLYFVPFIKMFFSRVVLLFKDMKNQIYRITSWYMSTVLLDMQIHQLIYAQLYTSLNAYKLICSSILSREYTPKFQCCLIHNDLKVGMPNWRERNIVFSSLRN